MKCPSCGEKVPESSRFCLACGAWVGGASEPVAPQRTLYTADGRPVRRTGTPISGHAVRKERGLVTLGLIAALVAGVVLVACGLVLAASGGSGDATPVSPLAGAGLGADTREAPPEPGASGTDVLAPGDQPATDCCQPPGDESPASGSVVPGDPAGALGDAFGLGEGETVEDCASADFADSLCYSPYLANLVNGRYVFQIGAPFSEFFAWALVERQSDGAFKVVDTADFDFEGDGTPPFSLDGAMAGDFHQSAGGRRTH